ncbi:hypothetical protein Tco_1379821, partial [Tanacetum coccineum]
GVRDKNLIYGGMLVTKIARSFGLLTNELKDALTVEEEEAEEEAEGELVMEESWKGSASYTATRCPGDRQVRLAALDGWTNKTSARSNLMLGGGNRRRKPIGCTTTPSVNSNTCPPETT